MRDQRMFLLFVALYVAWPIRLAAAPFAYITNECNGTVTVVDTATDAVVAVVPVGNGPVSAAVNPSGTRVYVANRVASTVSVIETSTNTVIATVPVGNSPIGIAVNPAGTRVYVANNGQGFSDNTVSVIDTAANTVIATIVVVVGPSGLALGSSGTRLYVVSTPASMLTVVDTSNNTVITTVSLNGSRAVCGVVVNPSGTRAYIAGSDAQLVHVLDTASNTVIAEVSVPGRPTPLALTPNGSKLYAGLEFGASTVAVVDTVTNSLVTAVPMAGDAAGVGITPDGTRAYVTLADSNLVQAINTATNSIVDTIAVPCPGTFGPQFIGPLHVFAAQIQPPINADGSSVFDGKRGVVPVKFTLTEDGTLTCDLPPATIALSRTSGSSPGVVDESVYFLPSDSGSNFRIDNCQYVYNLRTSSLGTGTYEVSILIGGSVIGMGMFSLN